MSLSFSSDSLHTCGMQCVNKDNNITTTRSTHHSRQKMDGIQKEQQREKEGTGRDREGARVKGKTNIFKTHIMKDVAILVKAKALQPLAEVFKFIVGGSRCVASPLLLLTFG